MRHFYLSSHPANSPPTIFRRGILEKLIQCLVWRRGKETAFHKHNKAYAPRLLYASIGSMMDGSLNGLFARIPRQMN